MATSYSDKLRLAIQGTGDNPSTWGQVANLQVFELIEDAISGYLTLNVSGSSNINLTTGNGTPDEARNAMIELTGFPIADFNILIPTVTKEYIFYATFTGTQTLTIKTASGVGVPIKSGQVKHVFCDGLDVIDVVPDLGALAYLDTITSTGLLANGVVTTSIIASGAVTTVQLAPGIVESFVPTGSIHIWTTTSAPVNYSLCDGGTLSRTTEAKLFNVIGTTFGVGDGFNTYNKPDLRGMFVRGWSTTSAQDPSGPRGVGSFQLDALQGHKHGSNSQPFVQGTGTGFGQGMANGPPFDTSGVISDDTFGTARVAAETRPKNIALTYIIKL